jgi:hypothetical protein
MCVLPQAVGPVMTMRLLIQVTLDAPLRSLLEFFVVNLYLSHLAVCRLRLVENLQVLVHHLKKAQRIIKV